MRDFIQPLIRGSRQIALAFAVVLCATTATATASAEPLVVIVNPASGIDSMTRNEVANVFMARDRQLAPGVTALPLDVAGDSKERQQFYASLVGKTVPQVNAYWARLLFTGRATPPQQVDKPADVLTTVADNKSAIGYIPKSKLDARVKVVLELDEP